MTTPSTQTVTPDLIDALRVLVKEHVGDWIYDIRNRAFEDDSGFVGNSWDHPRVTAFSNAVSVIEQTVKEADL